jgi:hypothetical protein
MAQDRREREFIDERVKVTFSINKYVETGV